VAEGLQLQRTHNIIIILRDIMPPRLTKHVQTEQYLSKCVASTITNTKSQ